MRGSRVSRQSRARKGAMLSGLAGDRDSEAMMDCVIQLPFAPTYRSVFWTEACPGRNGTEEEPSCPRQDGAAG
jgi:hypothetical protein